MADLQAENAALKRRLAHLEESQRPSASNQAPNNGVVSIVVLGASGDLARKKTFPSLFALFNHNLLPVKWHICGFARTNMTDDAFRAFLTKNLKGAADKIAAFVAKCHYRYGQYDSGPAFAELNKSLIDLEAKFSEGEPIANRVFYYAIPPSVFVPVSQALRPNAMAPSGWTRIVVEKPFGRDLESSNQLGSALGRLFSEDQIYRIDHYLGKELVQNLMVLRFANNVFEPLWNSHYISNVQITFKEDIGTDGRGGYFDEFGIIRDVMQNHLTQILALVAMEPPVSLDAEDVRDEKVKLLRAIPPIELSDCVIGQYVADKAGKHQGYLDDTTVPKGSVTPTFAAALLHINNTRWKGTPFVLKCGKALNERKAEVRIQFRQPPNGLFRDTAPNELVLRVQPGEAVYMKMTSKKPGLNNDNVQVELDLSYQDRFQVGALPDAYERLILEVLRGDHNLFVRADELAASWRIFTPLLHKLEKEKIKPETYEFGSRGPITGDELVKRSGFIRTEGYNWKPVANTSGRL